MSLTFASRSPTSNPHLPTRKPLHSNKPSTLPSSRTLQTPASSTSSRRVFCRNLLQALPPKSKSRSGRTHPPLQQWWPSAASAFKAARSSATDSSSTPRTFNTHKFSPSSMTGTQLTIWLVKSLIVSQMRSSSVSAEAVRASPNQRSSTSSS